MKQCIGSVQRPMGMRKGPHFCVPCFCYRPQKMSSHSKPRKLSSCASPHKLHDALCTQSTNAQLSGICMAEERPAVAVSALGIKPLRDGRAQVS